jgi:hypothetical protein
VCPPPQSPLTHTRFHAQQRRFDAIGTAFVALQVVVRDDANGV